MTTEVTQQEKIRSLCKSLHLDPDMTLRSYMEYIINDIIRQAIKEQVIPDLDFTNLNEFFNVDDFIEITWEELYTTLDDKCLLDDWSGDDKSIRKTINFGG